MEIPVFTKHYLQPDRTILGYCGWQTHFLKTGTTEFKSHTTQIPRNMCLHQILLSK